MYSHLTLTHHGMLIAEWSDAAPSVAEASLVFLECMANRFELADRAHFSHDIQESDYGGLSYFMSLEFIAR